MDSRQNIFTLNLVPWQSRIAKDFLDLEIYVDAVEINPGVIQRLGRGAGIRYHLIF